MAKLDLRKLVKLRDDHYIVIDDSEIKGEDWVLTKENTYHRVDYVDAYTKINEWRKITHSTKPLGFLNETGIATANLKPDWTSIKPLSLSEVEEAVFGYSVEKMAVNSFGHRPDKDDDDILFSLGKGYVGGYQQGFKAHQELVKDKLFTVEDMRRELSTIALEIATEDGVLSSESPSLIYHWIEDKIKTLLPKTEWDVEFDEYGKLRLA